MLNSFNSNPSVKLCTSVYLWILEIATAQFDKWSEMLIDMLKSTFCSVWSPSHVASLTSSFSTCLIKNCRLGYFTPQLMHDRGLCWSEERFKCFTGIGHFRSLNFAILGQSLTTTKKSHFNLIGQLTCKTAFSLIRVLFPVPHVCEHEVHSFHSSHRQSMGQRLTKQSFVSRSFFWHFWLPRWPRNRVRTPAN